MKRPVTQECTRGPILTAGQHLADALRPRGPHHNQGFDGHAQRRTAAPRGGESVTGVKKKGKLERCGVGEQCHPRANRPLLSTYVSRGAGRRAVPRLRGLGRPPRDICCSLWRGAARGAPGAPRRVEPGLASRASLALATQSDAPHFPASGGEAAAGTLVARQLRALFAGRFPAPFTRLAGRGLGRVGCGLLKETMAIRCSRYCRPNGAVVVEAPPRPARPAERLAELQAEGGAGGSPGVAPLRKHFQRFQPAAQHRGSITRLKKQTLGGPASPAPPAQSGPTVT